MSTRPRPPRAACPNVTILPGAGALMLLMCGACSSAPDVAQVSASEERPGGDATNQRLIGVNAFLPAIANISLDNERLFATGNAFFNQSWTEPASSNTARDGLGPLFNARGCSACHFKDGRGRPPLEVGEGFTSMLLRLSVSGDGADGEPVPEPNYGGQLQPFGVEGVLGEGTPRVTYESVPGQYADGEPYELLRPTYVIDDLVRGPLSADVRVSPRVAPAMIGLGLLEAIPEQRLLDLTDPDDADGDGISGHENQVWDVLAGGLRVGRFGWKAEQPSIRQQSAAAFVGDLGVTSSMFPIQDCSPTEHECQDALNGGDPEITDELLDRVERYAQMLAVPARPDFADPMVLRGKQRFTELGCDGCHEPSHLTSPDAPIEELREQLIWPYTDLLLHDMGEALSDDRPSFAAAGNEWRTPPLWGIGHYQAVNGHERLLHDGRARGVAEAILWHGGEATQAKDGFSQLGAGDRRDLIRFVESL
jgi:CxxC motif-containing protein (DUF1111 family)